MCPILMHVPLVGIRSKEKHGGGGVDPNQTRQSCPRREQRNKYKPRTETSTKQEQTEEQRLTIRHARRPADFSPLFDLQFRMRQP